MAAAVERGELRLHYQPVVDLVTGRCTGVEGLLRWEDPDRGLLLPDAFLVLAEAHGVLVDLAPSLLEQAGRASSRWAHHGTSDEPFVVHVNLSATQIGDPRLVDIVGAALTATGARPGSLVLEVTETSVMPDVDAAVSVAQRLRDLGVGLAVDDVGTGWSSLTSLRDLPLSGLKIDRSFVRGVVEDGADRAIVVSVLSLADSLGLVVVAEGVETVEQCVALREMGCRCAQGWLWSPALPDAALDTWLAGPHPEPQQVPARGRRRPVRTTREAVPDHTWSRIRLLQAQGASPQTITSALNSDGLTREDGRRWHVRAVARVIAERGRS